MNRTERAITAAVVQHRAGLSARWRACFAVSVVVGEYRRQATRALAADMALSVDQIERMAQAARTYLDLCRNFRADSEVMTRLRTMRRSLSPSHFAALGRLSRAYDLSPYEAVGELATAHETGASVADMAARVDEAQRAIAPTPIADYAKALARLAAAAAGAIRRAEIAGIDSFRLVTMSQDIQALMSQASDRAVESK